MPLPPTRYIDVGPGLPLANPQTAMAKADAMARMGATIQHVGEAGFKIAEKIRKVEEVAKISDFMRKADEKASDFSNSLMMRHDTEAWSSDWKSQTAEMRDELKNSGLSPEARASAETEFANWISQRTIHFETQAGSKSLAMGRAKIINAADYYFKKGMAEEGKKEIQGGGTIGLFNPAEVEEGLRRGDEIAAQTFIDEHIKRDPIGFVAQAEAGEIIKELPGATLDMIDRGKRKAEAVKESRRSDEMDKLELALNSGTLKVSDIEAAQFITKKDRSTFGDAMGKKDPPSNQDHAKAWEILRTLRESRMDPSITQEAYRQAWNDGRGAVLQRIAPQWQGDLKKELSYLSPAGRTSETPFTNGIEKSDLEAIGRDIAFRSRDAGIFGTIGDSATPAEKEKAYRKAEDVRLQVKRFVASDPTATPESVREYTDTLISGDRIKTNANLFQSFIPGAAQRLRPAPVMPTLPPKAGAKDKAAEDPLQIPAGAAQSSEALLPPRKQLEKFIN